MLGLLVPEADGGLGGDEVDLVLLLVELGRAGVPGPVLEHVAVAAPALDRLPVGAGAGRPDRSWPPSPSTARSSPTPASPTSC